MLCGETPGDVQASNPKVHGFKLRPETGSVHSFVETCGGGDSIFAAAASLSDFRSVQNVPGPAYIIVNRKSSGRFFAKMYWLYASDDPNASTASRYFDDSAS